MSMWANEQGDQDRRWKFSLDENKQATQKGIKNEYQNMYING